MKVIEYDIIHGLISIAGEYSEKNLECIANVEHVSYAFLIQSIIEEMRDCNQSKVDKFISDAISYISKRSKDVFEVSESIITSTNICKFDGKTYIKETIGHGSKNPIIHWYYQRKGEEKIPVRNSLTIKLLDKLNIESL